MHVILAILYEVSVALRANFIRTTLSILGVTIGSCAIILVGYVTLSSQQQIFTELETFGLKSIWVSRLYQNTNPQQISRSGTGIKLRDYFGLTNSDCCRAVEKLTPISVNYNQWIKYHSKYQQTSLYAVNQHYLDINNDNIIYGRNFTIEDIQNKLPVVIISSTIATALFNTLHPVIGKKIYIGNYHFTIIGIIADKNRDFLNSIGIASNGDVNQRLLMPITTYATRISHNDDIEWLQVQAKHLQQADIGGQQIVSFLTRHNEHRYQYQFNTMKQYIDNANNILDGVSILGIIVSLVSLIVGGIAIMNIMLTSVVERTKEIGLKKAIGANNNHILLQFLLEAIFICIIGSILGLTLGICISFITSVLLDLPWLINHNSIYIAILSSILVGIISGLYPAMTATKLQPVEALKRE
jgi:putative ABC transport system permease protein